MQEKKTLTFVVPAYNMTEYLERQNTEQDTAGSQGTQAEQQS